MTSASRPTALACTRARRRQRVRIGRRRPQLRRTRGLLAAVEEINRPQHKYQLATVDTPVGLHTFPLVDGKP